MNRDLYKAFAYNYIMGYKDNEDYLEKIDNQIIEERIKNLEKPYFLFNDLFEELEVPDNIDSIHMVSLNENNTTLRNSTNIKHVHFNFRFNCKINPEVLPDSIEHIVYDADNLLSNIKIGSFPRSLKKLEITHNTEHNQNKFYPGIFPDSIESLRLGNYYDQPLTLDILPKNLKFLTIYHNFREYMNELPKSLLQLTIYSTSFFDENDYMDYFIDNTRMPIIIYNNSMCRINDNIIICKDLRVIEVFSDFISDYINGKKKLIGQIIFEELLCVVFSRYHNQDSLY